MSGHLTVVNETLNQTTPNQLFITGPRRATQSPTLPTCHV